MKEPSGLGAEAELQRLLQSLGQDAPRKPPDSAHESAREARMAARIDAEVASLARGRRAARWTLAGVVAAAALFAVVVGAWRVHRGGALAISAEPVAAPALETATPVVAPAPRAAAPLAVPSATSPVSSSNRAVTAPAAPASAGSAEPRSTLGEENQLFKDAAEAGRDGDVSGAIARLDKLLVEHPASPLAQTALVRKFRLLATSGRGDEARREAERYLRLYPTGFAVSEAQALTAPAGQASP